MNTQPTHSRADGELGALFEAHQRTLASRLEKALALAEADGVVIYAGDPVVPDRDDQPYPFRAEPFFLQWCPLADVPGAALILAPGHRPRLLFPTASDFWHAAPAEPAGYWADAIDVTPVASAEARDRIVRREAAGFARIAADEGGRPTQILLDALAFERARKTAYEIECVRRANETAARGHVAAAGALADGCSEFELNLAYLAATGQTGDDLPYPNIVALNEHASILHYQRLERRPSPQARLLLVDAGARFAGYASDITRTSIPDGSPIADLHSSLESLQQTLCGEALAGVDFVDLNDRAHALLAAVLAEHRLVTCSADEAYATGLTRLFLPHGLGHLLGLQVHDTGGRQQAADGNQRLPPEGHPFLRLTRPLEPGFVVTIEPGLYFIDSLLDEADPDARRRLGRAEIDRLRPWGGIRIEDDVAVGARDNSNLTREAFAAIAEAPRDSNFAG